LTNNTVVLVFFPEIYTVYLHTAATVVWNHSCVTRDGSWPKHQYITRIKFVSSTLQNPVPCYARVRIPPRLQSYRRACACWLSGI